MKVNPTQVTYFTLMVILITFISTGLWVDHNHSDDREFRAKADKMKYECEIDLPRSEECVMLFAPRQTAKE